MVQQLSRRTIAAIIAIGVVVGALAYVVAPVDLSPLTRATVFIGAAMSLNLLIGNAGLISVGHGLFVGLGAYTVAVGTITFELPLAITVLIALGGSVVLALLTGLIALRAKALFFALLTLALSEVGFVYVSRSYAVTGGDDGLAGIPVPEWLFPAESQHLMAVAVTTVILLAVLVLLASPFGATLRAIRDNRDRVASLGGNPKLYELSAFMLAGVLGTVAGMSLAISDRLVTPEIISWTTGTLLLVMIAVGGRFSFFGPVLGVVLLELTRSEVQAVSVHADLVIGVVVIACAVAFPDGIAGRFRSSLSRFSDRGLKSRTETTHA